MNARIRQDALVLSRTPAAIGSLVGGGSILPAATNSVNSANLGTFNFALGTFGPFNGFRFIYANHTNTPALVDNACGGTSSTAFPGGIFNIALPESGWSAPTGPVSIPAAVGASQSARDKNPGLALSPLIPGKSIPRAPGELDGGRTELIIGRAVFLESNTNGTYTTLSDNFPASWDPINNGISVLTAERTYGSDTVTSPGDMPTSVRETLAAINIVGVVPVYDQPRLCVGGPGDSVAAGMASTSTAIGAPFAFKAVSRLAAAGSLVSFLQAGLSGSPQTAINARAHSLAALNIIDIMPLACYTINSPVAAQKDWDAQWSLTLDAVQAQLNQRATNQVILQTPLPNDSFNTAQNNFRAKQRNRCLALAAALPRISIVDYDVMTNTATGHFLHAEDTVDGTHMTDSGNERASIPFQTALERLL